VFLLEKQRVAEESNLCGCSPPPVFEAGVRPHALHHPDELSDSNQSGGGR